MGTMIVYRGYTDADAAVSRNVAARRERSNLGRVGAYGAPDDPQLHLDGAHAENAFRLWAGLPLSQWTHYRSGNPRDIGEPDVGRFEVRSTRHHDGRLPVHHEDPDDWPFALVYIYTEPPNPWRFGMAGYLECAADGKRQEYWRTDVRYPAFFVPRHSLRSWRDVEDLAAFTRR
jgi:hypothetical protein